MTGRIQRLTVVLAEDMREDDAQNIVNAILQLRGVLSVGTGVVAPGDFVARQRARHELREAVLATIDPPVSDK